MSRINDKNIESAYPLSPMQQGMLFHSLYSPESSVYVEQLTCTLVGTLDVTAFQRAIDRAVERHAVLRTSFVWKRLERMLQIVHKSVPVPVMVEDWSQVPAEEQILRFEAHCAQERQKGFNFAKPPLLRISLLRLSDAEHRLVWSHHHVLMDGWSLGILVREVLESYVALVAGREPTISPPRPYRDFILWLQRQDLGRAEQFWRGSLEGFTSPTPFGVEETAGRVREQADYATQTILLPADETSRVGTLARRAGVTLNTLLQAAWAILLRAYGGSDDVVFGATVSGRPPEVPGSDRMVGLFINTLPVRVKFSGLQSVADLVQSLHRFQGELREYEHTPLVQIQSWSDVPKPQPLFESILVFENYPVGASLAAWGEVLSIKDVRAAERTNYPLTVVSAPGEELPLQIAYDTRRFSRETIRRMLGHLATILREMTASPECRIDSLPLMSGAERAEILEMCGGGVSLPADEATIHELFEAQVARAPDVTAVRCGSEEISYGELNRRANRIAHRLRSSGVGPEVAVGIAVPRSIEAIASMIAVLKSGGVYVMLEGAGPIERLRGMIVDAGVRHLIVRHDRREAFADFAGKLIDLDQTEEDPPERVQGNARPVVFGDNAASIVFTSGSTGRPKGVTVTHRGLANHALWCRRQYALVPGDRMLGFLSLSFDACAGEIFPALITGIPLVLHPSPSSLSGTEMLRFCATEGLTVLRLPAAYWHQMVSDATSARAEIPASVRLLVVGGESPSSEKLSLWQRLAGRWVHFLNEYGPTETTVVATCYEAQMSLPVPGSTVPIGIPIQNVQVRVVDRTGMLLPVGVPGELCIAGDGVARGYVGRPDATAEKFVPAPDGCGAGSRMYRTGDRVRLLPDGNLEFIGRIDDQIKIRGFRVEPGEVESRLRRHPDVREAVVMLREATGGDTMLVAYVVPRSADHHDGEGLVEFVRAALPEQMVPGAVVYVDAIPLTPNGKVDRRRLPSPLQAGREAESQTQPLASQVEELLAGIWSSILGVGTVGRADDFFRMGGHSLRATQLLSRIREVFGAELPLKDVFEHPTLADLARRIELIGEAGEDTPCTPIERSARGGDIPLSFPQQRLWFLDQLAPGRSAYNISAAFRLSGSLSVSAVQGSLEEIVRRHEILRTSFDARDGRPVQRIGDSIRSTLASCDLSGLRNDGRDGELVRLLREDSQRSFDLGVAPLFRATLYRLSPEEHVLQLTIHHIVADGWSLGVLLQEFAELYAALSAGVAPTLPPLEIQYADFARWQREVLQGSILDRQLEYWREALAGIPAMLELLPDRPRPAVQTSEGATRSITLSGSVVQELEEICRKESVTPFMAMLAVFQTLLHRYSGQDDVLVGSPVANRARRETEKLIGFFVNTLVFRARFEPRQTFGDLLRQVRGFCLGAFAHQDLPFERLVEEMQPSRDLSHTPLFQVAFVFQNTPPVSLTMPGLVLSPMVFEVPTAKYDLTMTAVPARSEMEVHLEYNTDLFDPETVDRMLVHFRNLLEQVVRNPEVLVAHVPLMPEEESRRVLASWNSTEAPFPASLCVHEWFEQEADRRPEAIALSFQSTELTYGHLNRSANQLARHLISLGVGTETPVGICMERSPEMVVGILATLKAGGAFVPLDPAYPPARLRYMVEDSGIRILLTQHSIHDRIPLPEGEIVVVDRDWLRIVAEDGSNIPLRAFPDSLAYLIYTSGSTGQPKGAMLRHQGLCNLAGAQIAAFGVGPGSRILQFSSLSFDASVWEIVMALLSGATLALTDRETLSTGQGLLEVLRHQRISTVTLPPSVLAVLPKEDVPDLQTIITAGEKCTAELVRAWGDGRRFFNAYGPTETTVCASLMLVDREFAQGPPIGRPLRNARIYLLDRNLQPVPVGVPGELTVGGVLLARGYWRRPDVTAEKFIPDPFAGRAGERLYRTGDLARYLPDGSIEFLGRIDSQVKVRGFRIELGEIETVLDAHEGVRDAAVVVREDAPGDRRVVAYVVPREPGCVTPADLRLYLKERLPEYMVPSAFVSLPAMPLTPNGKIDRKALPAPDSSRRDSGRDYVPPRNPTEEHLARIAATLLGVEKVGVHDNFFELGGHSLLATQFMSRVRGEFGVQLPLRALFEMPTVADLGVLIMKQMGEEGQLSVPEIRAQARGDGSLEDLLREISEIPDQQVRAMLSEGQSVARDRRRSSQR